MADEYDDFVEVSYEGEELDLGDLLASPLGELVELFTGSDQNDKPVTATEAEGTAAIRDGSDSGRSDDDWLGPAPENVTVPGSHIDRDAGGQSTSGGSSLGDLGAGPDSEVDAWLEDSGEPQQPNGLSMPEWLTREPPADETPEEKEARERTEQAKMDTLAQEHANIETALRGIKA